MCLEYARARAQNAREDQTILLGTGKPIKSIYQLFRKCLDFADYGVFGVNVSPWHWPQEVYCWFAILGLQFWHENCQNIAYLKGIQTSTMRGMQQNMCSSASLTFKQSLLVHLWRLSCRSNQDNHSDPDALNNRPFRIGQ